MPSEIVSIKGVAEYLSLHEMTVYKLASEGKIPGFKVGGQWRFQKDDLEQWIKNEVHKKEMGLAKKDDSKIKKILIVDDNPDDIELITKTLKEAVYECKVVSAKDGFEAWKQVLEFHPYLVILDLNLPDVDGFKICKSIRSDKDAKDTKILAITAFVSPETRKKILSAGADDFMEKDFMSDELLERVTALCVESK